MCLPRARGTGLAWQRYPKQRSRCARLGVKVTMLGLECVRRTFSGSVRNAANYWMSPPGPFVYRTVYGDEWQPKLGQECSTHQLTLEQSIFQGSLRGLYATCLPSSDGSLWTWQNGFPKLNGPCARAGHTHGKLVCVRVGNSGRWKKAPKGAVAADAMVLEIKQFFARTGSEAMNSWVDQLQLFMFASFAMKTGALGDLQSRAALAGVKLTVDEMSIDSRFSLTLGGVTSCFKGMPMWGGKWNWWGSSREIQEIPCSVTAATARAGVVAALTEMEGSLRQSNDIQRHSANLIRLRDSVSAAYAFDASTGSGIQRFSIYWKYTVNGSNQLTSSLYKVVGGADMWSPSVCYASSWNGTSATLSEVSCA